MQKVFTAGFLMLTFTTSFLVSSATTKSPSPAIFLPVDAWDFGEIEHGKVAEHVFIIENRGTAALAIKSFSASCNCVTGLLYTPGMKKTGKEKPQSRLSSPRYIPAGKKGRFVVFFDTAGRIREFRNTVFLFCNDPVTPVVRIKITGFIIPKKSGSNKM